MREVTIELSSTYSQSRSGNHGSAFHPNVQAKLEPTAQDSGRRSDELVEDAVIGYFDELAFVRETLDGRYDGLESGKVKPIDGEDGYRRLMERTEIRVVPQEDGEQW